MSTDVLESADRATRIIYGKPEVVESELNRLGDTYTCTSLFYYVVGDHLEVAATLIHMREIKKAQFMAGAMQPGARR